MMIFQSRFFHNNYYDVSNNNYPSSKNNNNNNNKKKADTFFLSSSSSSSTLVPLFLFYHHHHHHPMDRNYLHHHVITSNRQPSLLSAQPKSSSSSSMILACSSSSSSSSSSWNLNWNDNDRVLCQDRKGWFDHLYPTHFIKSTIKIVVVQSAQVMSHYLNDQLRNETELDEKVNQLQITRRQAIIESDAWAEKEWKLRIEALPKRIMIAFAKFHAITFVMRSYEYIASRIVTEDTLDKLTLDTFDCAKRTSQTSDGLEIIHNMFYSSWNASIIFYLADYSVHQMILCYGYYLYMQQQKKKKRQQIIQPGELYDGSPNNSSSAIESGSIALSFLKKSTMLAMQRTLCLLSSSMGGAVGSWLKPGRGTNLGLTVGDTLAANITADLMSTDAPSLSS